MSKFINLSDGIIINVDQIKTIMILSDRMDGPGNEGCIRVNLKDHNNYYTLDLKDTERVLGILGLKEQSAPKKEEFSELEEIASNLAGFIAFQQISNRLTIADSHDANGVLRPYNDYMKKKLTNSSTI